MRYSAIRNLVASDLRSFITNDPRKQLDVQLKELAIAAQQYAHLSKGKRIALTRLINAIWQSGKLVHPYKGQFELAYEDIYDEAVQNLFFYLCQDNNINKYDPERGEVMTWVNMLLTKRFFPEAIPKVLGKTNEINLESSHWENIPSSQPLSLFEQVRECIETDPELIFRKEHIKGHPEANFQAIAKRRCSGISWKDISAEWGIGITSLHTFYQRCLNKFGDQFRGYLF
ncbi:sigma-70 family RNA polymerase sigma factor [Nostoc sp.]|uniref:sigma-70 family RNA polymerase sigma factor n=2 Tax=Nostoc sp. TaxID=1180 RepID=UPI002FF9EFFA